MRAIFLLFGITTVYATQPVILLQGVDEIFESWMQQHQKKYLSKEELNERKKIFIENLKNIEALKSTEEEATFGLNKFSDLTSEEFSSMYKGYKRSSLGVNYSVSPALPEEATPSSVDWRSKKVNGFSPVTAVKNQGQCGSCWAFSATEGIESARIMQGGNPQKLSPQEIVSCDATDAGCGGGDLPTAFAYVESISTPTDIGLTLASKYPYLSGTTGVSGICERKLEKHGKQPIKMATYAVTPCDTSSIETATSKKPCQNQAKKEPQLAAQLLKHGPISICVNAQPWQSYVGGILKNEKNCPGGQMDLDHWATDWGEKGYIYLEMGKNMCGVADEPMFVTDIETTIKNKESLTEKLLAEDFVPVFLY